MVPVIHMFSKFGKIRKFPNKDHNIIRFFLHKFCRFFRINISRKKKKKKKSNGYLMESCRIQNQLDLYPNNNNSNKVHFSSKFIRYISWESVGKKSIKIHKKKRKHSPPLCLLITGQNILSLSLIDS